MKRKILFVMRCFPSLGGVEKLSLQLAKAFTQADYQVSFVSWLPAQEAWSDCQAFPIAYMPNSQAIDAPDNLAFLKSYIENEQIDIVLNQVPESRVYRYFVNHPKHKVINVLHADPAWLFQRRRQMDFPSSFWKFSQWKQVLRWFSIKLFPALSDQTVCRLLREEIGQAAAYVVLHPSYQEKIQHYLKESYPALANKLYAIPNPVAASDVQTSGEKIILYTGRFSCKDKGLDILLRVWAKIAEDLPDWQLQLRGDGPDKALLQTMIDEYRLTRVTLLPPLWDESLYAQASVFALPSRTEAQGLSQMEAQQAGLVPVAFRLNAMIEESMSAGCLVPCFDEAAYADALRTICQDEALRKERSQCARLQMQHYHEERILPMWLQLFDELLA